MSVPLRVLLVEDSPDDALLLVLELQRGGYDPTYERVETAQQMREALARQPWDIILADYSLPHFSGTQALEILKDSELDIPFILISGTVPEQIAIDLMRGGAKDFVFKTNLSRLAPAVERELKDAEIRRERQAALDALRESERRFRRIVETAGEGIWSIDAEGRTTYANQQMADMLRCTREELLERSVYDIVDPTEIPVVKEYIVRHEPGVTYRRELNIHRCDGTELVVLVASTALTDDDHVTGILGMLTDITDRKHAEQIIEQERAFVNSAIDLLPFPIIFNTPSGEILRANQASNEFFQGMNPADWWNLDFYTANTRTLVPKEEWPIWRAAHGEVVPATEGVIRLLNGQETPVLVFAAPVYVGSKLVAIVAAFQDISALKEADRAKNQFLAILSHELRTPLTNILGWANEAQSMPEIVPQALAIILRNADSQRRMLDNLLEITRMLYGKLTLTHEMADLWDLAEQAVDEFRMIAEERKIAIALAPPEKPLPVNADKKRLRVAISNLLDNALKFSSPGDRVTISGKRAGDRAVLMIHDTGHGISPEQFEGLFRLFNPAPENETTRGMRLGLALTKSIIELHGGQVTADSPGLGHGSTFTIELPLSRE